MSKRKKIYVVRGTTGEYSDCTEWSVFAFDDESEARNYADKCSARANEIKQWQINNKKDSHIPETFKDLDPDIRMDYTGTNYFVESVEMYEDTVTRFAKGRYKEDHNEHKDKT